MIARLTLRYLAIFAIVLAALSVGAYEWVAGEYAGMLQPALGTPEAAQAYRVVMNRAIGTILAFDLPLLALVGIASWFLARASIAPLLEARERQRNFVADAAHGLRSPLAVIASVAQASKSESSPESTGAFETIAQAALDASQVVADLLTLAREATPELLQSEPGDIGAVAATVTKEYTALAAQSGLHLTVDAQSAIVNGDERRLREMLRNLIENALRHARSSATIVARKDGAYAELLVSDDGNSVPAALRERVFERFFRASDDGKGSGSGHYYGGVYEGRPHDCGEFTPIGCDDVNKDLPRDKALKIGAPFQPKQRKNFRRR